MTAEVAVPTPSVGRTRLIPAGPIRSVSVVSTGTVSIHLVPRFAELNPDLVVLPAHDPGAADRLRRANESGDRAPGSRR
ncbi:MAG TPA: hypothetical protein VES19_04795 [Candidatus Limnocylindrales bacterium]|nr:hypothetical protein [Candidatus Limnocylindrales bacterium]